MLQILMNNWRNRLKKMQMCHLFCWIICLIFMAMPAMAERSKFKVDGLWYCYIEDAANLTASIHPMDKDIWEEVTIPDKVEYDGKEYTIVAIEESAFYGSKALKSITLPNTIIKIGKQAFYHCDSLTSITIPNSVTTIGQRAFYYCEGLALVIIPSSVTSIGSESFTGISVIINQTDLEEDRWGAKRCINGKYIEGDFVYSDEKKDTFAYYLGEDAEVSLPNTVTAIGDNAFYGHTNLTSVSIPNSLTSIGGYAFYGCESLTSFAVPSGVTSIGKYAFYDCQALTSIDIPSGVTVIGDRTFEGCNSLLSVTIPNGITSIGWYAFSGCTSLLSVDIPNSVTSIGQAAFEYCTSLKPVVIPPSVTSTGGSAFYDVDTIYYAGSAGFRWGAKRNIKGYVVEGDFVYWDETKETLGDYLGSDTAISIPDFVSSIGDYAFTECSRLTSVSIPKGVTSIRKCAFNEREDLITVSIPSTVTYIGEDAFYNCKNLSSVFIPSSVETIGSYAFYNVDTIYYAGSATGSPWRAKHRIKANVDENGFVYADETLIRYIGTDSIVVIPDNVVTIGDSVFFNNTTIQSVVIPNSVETIGSYAFAGCTGISRLSVPYTVSYIGEDAFSQVDTVSYGGFAVWQWWETQYWGALNFDEEGDGLYIIHNLEELLYFRDSVKGIARLEADIDLSPVCGKVGDEMVSFTPIKCLKFDGGNHTISNLYINQPDNDKEVALFDTEDKIYKLLIQNLKVTNAYVKGGEYAAGIANNGIFVNCHFEGVVIGKYAGGVSEYGKPSSAYNCSNYGMVVSSSYSSGIDASSMYNCYNRGRIVSEKSVVGLGMYDGYHFNLYNAGSIEAPSFTYINTRSDLIESALAKHRGNLFVLQEMDSTAFLSGAVKDSLNKYVSENPKAYDYYSDSIPLLQWVQGEDGFPRFEGVDLKPTQGYVVRYKGEIEDYDVALNGTVALPVCRGNSYVFSNNFDGKNIVSDTTIIVEMAKKDSIWGLEMRGDFDADGYISLSFYTNMDNEGDRFDGIHGDFYAQNECKEYFFVNSYLFSKAGVICNYIQENDSVWKVTLDSIYYITDYDSLVLYEYVSQSKKITSNVLSWTKAASGDETSVSTIGNPALEVYADDKTIHVANAQPNTKILVLDMNGKIIVSATTDAEGSAEMKLSAVKGTCVVSDGNQSTKVIIK